MRIRRSTIEDSLELSKLRKATIRQTNRADYTPAQIKRWSKRWNVGQFQKMHDEFFRYVAVQNGKIVGYADIRRESPEEMGGLYVHKDFIRQGIGAKLMKKIEQAVKALGVNRFSLRSSITAKEFYEKIGYRLTGVEKNRRKGDEFLMEKLL